MPLASVLPSAGTTSALLERRSQVAALQALAETAMEGGGRFVVIEEAPVSARRDCSRRRALAGSAGMRVLAAAAASSKGSSRTGSSGSCSSRCSRRLLRFPARSCYRGPQLLSSHCSQRLSSRVPTARPKRALGPSRSFTASTGLRPTLPSSSRRCWRSTTCTGQTLSSVAPPPDGKSSTGCLSSS